MTSFMKEFEHLKIQLEEVKRATNNFDKTKVIGSGGFGAVFKGEVSNCKGRSMVAIKRLDRKFGQGDPEFLKEIMMLSRYTHQNLISLVGYCDERDEKILVYSYVSNGSLDHHLGDPGLTWTQRLNICLGAAKGLSYLHDPNEAYQRILHCDIKSANILLDENFNAKVADFGLAKMGPANQQYSFLVTNASGTAGYCDPQYMATYTLTKESDVYSFGVVLFEVLCGKLCFQYSNGQLNVFVPTWKKCCIEKKLAKIIFQDLTQEMDPTSLETFLNIAFQCLYEYREGRPTMSVVVERVELALKYQKLHDLKLEKILEATVDPLVYRSRYLQELELLRSNGLFLNLGKTWLSLNDKGQHCLLISIDQCFDSSYKCEDKDYSSRYSLDYNSRFQVGTYNTRGEGFSIRVSLSKFLTRGITYMLNLVFKCPEVFNKKHTWKQEYITIGYKIDVEKEKSSIVFLRDNREDEWLMAGLYQFTTTKNNQSSNNTIVDLKIKFELQESLNHGLEIEGIEFQPLENVNFKLDNQVLIDKYRAILEAAAYPPLMYRSVQDLKLLLSRGVLLNGGKTRFSLNDHGQHCELISIAECLIPGAEIDNKYSSEYNRYSSDYNSRFQVGTYNTRGQSVLTFVRSKFLSPGIKYRMNLVFKYPNRLREKARKQQYISIRYKLEGEDKVSFVYIGDKREDDWLMAGLYLFTASDQTPLELECYFHTYEYHNGLEIEGIEFQPLERLELEHEDQVVLDRYQEILEAAHPRLIYKSVKELELLFSKGVFLNGGNMWFSLMDKGLHYVMISIDSLVSYKGVDYHSRYSHDYNSRFQVGTYNTRGKTFSTRGRYFDAHVGSEFLSPGITYMVNLVFKCPNLLKLKADQKKPFIAITYQLKGEEDDRISIVHVGDKREDEWLMAALYQFNTSDNQSKSFIDLRIYFEGHEYFWNSGLEIEGIEFQPLEDAETGHDDQVVFDHYKEILEAASPPLFYRCAQELHLLLSRGVLLNRGKTWFYINDNGQHCEMISIAECLIPDANKDHRYSYNSRFPVGSLYSPNCNFRTRIRTQFLSPYIIYTVNLVFRFEKDRDNSVKQYPIWLEYKLDGSTTTWISYLASKREDNWWMVELCQFTSDGSNVDLRIIFEGAHRYILAEGIEFQPLEKVDHQVLEYEIEKESDRQSLLDSDDHYWEQKLPNDYHGIIKWSKDDLQWATKKELYSILFGTGFLISNGQEWFFLDKIGKRCQMLSARAAFLIDDEVYQPSWQSLPESRFGEAYVAGLGSSLQLHSNIKSQVLSPQTAYASYLVYKLPAEDQSRVEGPVEVRNLSLNDNWYIYLVSPPQTPSIDRGDLDPNIHRPANRPKLKGLPQQRSDGWMEVQVWEFQTGNTPEMIPMSLSLNETCGMWFDGFILQGIEFRPI